MDHGGRAIRNRDWLKSGEEADNTSGSVSYSVKLCTRLSLSLVDWLLNELFHNDYEISEYCKMQAILV